MRFNDIGSEAPVLNHRMKSTLGRSVDTTVGQPALACGVVGSRSTGAPHFRLGVRVYNSIAFVVFGSHALHQERPCPKLCLHVEDDDRSKHKPLI